MATNGKNSTKTADKLLNIGLGDKARKSSIEILTATLANTFVLYTKSRKFHWNVTGMHFKQLHELFEEQYTILEEAMDETAERVRMLGGISIGTTSEMAQHSALKEAPGVNPDAEGMVRELLTDHETVIQALRQGIDKTTEAGDAGTADFLTGLLESHEKMAWFLRAHLE
ncbi:MAG: DNA starvation/stationary phase protection protein [Pleurocapsa minor GSE-CHR-MK-17-07R]|nr:DNA starvation/stationary phase protection protein [Pleurocapsa minor GSE-CHR-MK 17-07R]